jgi:hypothetical protein
MPVSVINPGWRPDQTDSMLRLLQLGYNVYQGSKDQDNKDKELALKNQAVQVELAKNNFTASDQDSPGSIRVPDAVTGKDIFFRPPAPKTDQGEWASSGERDSQGRLVLYNKKTGEQRSSDEKLLNKPEKDPTPSFEFTGATDKDGNALVLDKRTGKLVTQVIPGGVKPKPTQPNQGEFTAAQFGRRVESANDVMDQLEKEGFKRTDKGQGFASVLPNVLKPGALVEQEQAERNFINAILRRESGAAISPSEFKSAEQQYFPRPGDTEEVLANKKQNRLQAFAGLKAEAGNAWEKVPKVASLRKPKEKDTDGKALAAPKLKDPSEMTDEERAAELKRLKGGK